MPPTKYCWCGLNASPSLSYQTSSDRYRSFRKISRLSSSLLARQVAAALQQQDALAGWRQLVRERAAAGARADDDDV